MFNFWSLIFIVSGWMVTELREVIGLGVCVRVSECGEVKSGLFGDNNFFGRVSIGSSERCWEGVL